MLADRTAVLVKANIQLLVAIMRLGLDEQLPAGREQLAEPGEQTPHVTAESDVAVEEEDGRPTSFARKPRENVAPQDAATATTRQPHRGESEVYSECRDAAFGERSNKPTRAAADVEHRSAATRDHAQIGLVDRREEPGDV